MLNAGNELVAEGQGCVRLAGVAERLSPYLGTVVVVAGEQHLDAGTRLSRALVETAAALHSGDLTDAATEAAARRLDLDDELAARYVARLRDPLDGLVPDGEVDLDALRTILRLRTTYLPGADGSDVYAGALDPDSGLVHRPGRDGVTARPSPLRLLQATAVVSTLDRFAMAPMLVAMSRDLDVPLAAVVQAAGIYFLAYGLCQPVWGVVSDRIGRVRTMRVTLVLAAGCTIASAFAESSLSLAITRGLAGAFFGAAFPATLIYLGDVVPAERRQPDVVRLMAGVAIGTAVASVGAGVLAGALSWRVAFLVTGAAALLLTVALRSLPEPDASAAAHLPARAAARHPPVPRHRAGAGAGLHRGRGAAGRPHAAPARHREHRRGLRSGRWRHGRLRHRGVRRVAGGRPAGAALAPARG